MMKNLININKGKSMGKTKKDILDELENIKQDITGVYKVNMFDIGMKITEIQWAINVHLRETGDF